MNKIPLLSFLSFCKVLSEKSKRINFSIVIFSGFCFFLRKSFLPVLSKKIALSIQDFLSLLREKTLR
jgi:hypothetical protein